MFSQRMYSIVLRHLSGIQKGIQSGHSIVEFQLKYGDSAEYRRWAKKDKTMIVLEAGTSQLLEKVAKRLKTYGVDVASFYEPDIGNTITSISFLADERVWNSQKYSEVDSTTILIRDMLKKFNLASN